MSKSQKDAVVEQVLKILPTFVKGTDNALMLLTKSDLDLIKINIAHGIINGDIAYGKSTSNAAEVHAYARSMVMNHLKKAKELNSSQTYAPLTTRVNATPFTSRTTTKVKSPKGVDLTILSEDLKEFVLQLV